MGHLLERNTRETLFHVVQDGLQNIQACSGHDRAWHAAIRWLAGGSYLDIADHCDVSKATFYRLVYECIDLIIDAFPISFPLSSEDALGSLAADFVAKQSKTIFMRVVGVIDRILVKIRCPSAHECHGAQLPIPLQSFTSTQPTQHILHKLLLTHI